MKNMKKFKSNDPDLSYKIPTDQMRLRNTGPIPIKDIRFSLNRILEEGSIGGVDSTEISYGTGSYHDDLCMQFKQTRGKYFDYKKAQSGKLPELSKKNTQKLTKDYA
mmetsp:Transcript_4329/g.3632  ORF Transcript_4329/g.3632 Transcript_4329/m.3632 type:complete len:107 (+) Transcript_4329:354-674(+)